MGQFKADEAGYTNASYQIDNVTTSGSLTIDRSSGSLLGGSVGGLIGQIQSQKGGNSHIKNSVSSATITATKVTQVGGLIGVFSSNTSEEAVTVLIDSCSYQNSSSTALSVQDANFVGGFIGQHNPGGILSFSGGSVKISNSYANAGIKFTVTRDNQSSRAAGFIANMKNGGAIETSYAQGTIDFDTQTSLSSGWRVSGFVAQLEMDSADPLVKASIDDSYSTVGITVDQTVGNLKVGGFLGWVRILANPNEISVNNVYYYTKKFEIAGDPCTGGAATKNCNGLTNGSYGGLVGGTGTLNQDVKITGYDNLGFLGNKTDQNARIIVYQGKGEITDTPSSNTTNENLDENDVDYVDKYDGKPDGDSGPDWSLSNLEGNNLGSWSSAIWKDNGPDAPPTLK
jgi:hypothetical protein